MANKPIKLFVRDREQTLYDGEVSSISSKNTKGVFDILPHHSNFIALINDKLILKESNGGTKEIQVDSGIIKVLEGEVHIYLGVKK